MNDEVKSTFDQIVDNAVEQAGDGSVILDELNPDLPWINLRDLVGERICVIKVDDAQPGLGDDAVRVIYTQEDKVPLRFSSEHNVVISQLRDLKPYLPLWVTVTKRMGANKLEYFILE